MNKKIFLAGLLCLASVASVVGTVGNAHKVEAATDDSKEKWSAIGTISGSSWNKDFPLSYDSTDDRYELEIALSSGNEFKIRLNNDWGTSIGYGGHTGAGISTYLSNNDGNFKVKTTGNYILWVKDDNVRNYGDKSYGFGIDKAADVVYHTVTHYSQDGTVLKTDDKVIENSAYEPAFAEVEGYALEGWYKDQALTQKMEKGAKVTGDLTLYPKYVEAEDYVVYFTDSSAALGSTVYAYMYSDHTDGHYNVDWPGLALTKDGNRGWKIEVDASKSFDTIIFNNGKATATQTQNINLTQANNLDTFVLGAKDTTSGQYDATLQSTGIKYEVADLLTSYYNDGEYLRHTEINLSEDAKKELVKCFHAESNLLVRDTYFKGEELWMTHHESGYSYYGTEGSNTVYARTNEAKASPEKTSVAIKGKGMTTYFTTLKDIKDNTAEWTKTGNVYSTTDPAVIQMFLDFTAPCFLNSNDESSNYFSLDHVEVEQKGETLELRLVTTGDQGKLTDANDVLSVATITK